MRRHVAFAVALALLVTGLNWRLAAAYSPDEVQQSVVDAAERYGVSSWLLLAVARCESPGLNPYLTGRAGELGLFQLHPRGLQTLFYQVGYSDVWDYTQQADFAGWAFSIGLAHHWSCYRIVT